MKKERVLLTGASGSMGFESFMQLWSQRERFDIVLLLRPSKKNRKRFRIYEKDIKIVWGDIQHMTDVAEACRGIDVCLHPMALISPEADRNPEMAEKVNHLGTKNLVEAIEAENAEHIRLIYIGTVAVYGGRLAPVHTGRTGDPVIPSVYDHYALSKISGELAVMQSKIKHRVSLRQTFIMIPDLFSLKDPIMFHQPINSFMENITARDSGRLMLNCLDVPADSDFWGGYYNIGGGPSCRTSFLEFLERIYGMLGLRFERTMERSWFALKNFHMMFFEDSEKLNAYLHHWEGGQSLEDYYQEVWKKLPAVLKLTAKMCRALPFYRSAIEKITRAQLRKLAVSEEGTLHWYQEARKGNEDALGRIGAFYTSPEAFDNIPDWGHDMPSQDHGMESRRLAHGYDEAKEGLEWEDLQRAAAFRGGSLLATSWDGDMHARESWKCNRGHAFRMTPHAVLKGGHWCHECIAPPWNYREVADGNPFAAQVIRPEK